MVYVKNMAQLDKDDLVQMNEDYFKSLEKERLVEVAKNLHQLATDLWEKQQQSSEFVLSHHQKIILTVQK